MFVQLSVHQQYIYEWVAFWAREAGIETPPRSGLTAQGVVALAVIGATLPPKEIQRAYGRPKGQRLGGGRSIYIQERHRTGLDTLAVQLGDARASIMLRRVAKEVMAIDDGIVEVRPTSVVLLNRHMPVVREYMQRLVRFAGAAPDVAPHAPVEKKPEEIVEDDGTGITDPLPD